MAKAVSNENLAQFKANCDQTYAKVGESSKGGYQDQEYIDSRFDVGSLTYTDNTSGISIPVNYYYQKGSVDPNTVAINGTIDFSVSGSAMLSVPFTTYAEFYCALQLCFEYGAISGTSYDLEVQCNDIETLRSNIQTYWAFPYDFSVYKYPNAPYVYSDYGVKDFDIKIEESGQYISSGFHRDSYHFYYEVNTTGFIKNVDSKYKINFTSYSNVLPSPASGYTGQVPVVNAAGNGYELQAQSSGGITQSTVIERPEELPTATADSPDFVQTPDGTLYRKKAVESGSLLGTWVFNKLGHLSRGVEYILSFTSNGNSYSKMRGNTGAWRPEEELYYNDTLVSNTSLWINDAYKTIQITDTSALTNEAEFTSWLTANATQTSGGASVSYEYVAQQDAGASGGGTQLKGYSGTIFTNPEFGVRVSAIHADGSITIFEGDGGNVDVENVVRLIIAGELDGTNSRWCTPREDSEGGGYKITYLGKGWSDYTCYSDTTGPIFIEAVPTGDGFQFGAIAD